MANPVSRGFYFASSTLIVERGNKKSKKTLRTSERDEERQLDLLTILEG